MTSDKTTGRVVPGTGRPAAGEGPAPGAGIPRTLPPAPLHRALQPYAGLGFGLQALARRIEPDHPAAAPLRQLLALAQAELRQLNGEPVHEAGPAGTPEDVTGALQALLLAALDAGLTAGQDSEMELHLRRHGDRLLVRYGEGEGVPTDPRILAAGARLTEAGARVLLDWDRRGKACLDVRLLLGAGDQHASAG